MKGRKFSRNKEFHAGLNFTAINLKFSQIIGR